eukprot:TRINITY_DN43774_c0_g1_i1.p1 TRINITY_DN43774_c0_g1~~TRINITY_DN43774_c0_g1_i1.p1  ORF type:complete len:564 (-),score=78.32 TRINITY_DN43774_c0_g1_i1:178-1656(-)
MANGHGRFIEANGEVYVGEWLDDMRFGKGVHYYSNGQVEYDGDWRSDVYNGFGTLYYESGDKYVGEWLNEERHGKGILYYHSGDRYEGSWKQDMANGLGNFIEANGKVYTGQWKDDKRHGYGTCYYANGKKEYEGEWKNDCYHGQGTIYYENNDKFNGGWKNDEKHGFGIFWYACGNRYQGEWKNDVWHGRGVLFYASGDKYDGEWRNGMANGYGIFTSIDGEVYKGQWRDDQRHGFGALYGSENQLLYSGQWIADEQVPDAEVPMGTYNPLDMDDLDSLLHGSSQESEELSASEDDDDESTAPTPQAILRRSRGNSRATTAPMARPSSGNRTGRQGRATNAPVPRGGMSAPQAMSAPSPTSSVVSSAHSDDADGDDPEVEMMDITTWLKRQNLEKYAPIFVREDIDVSTLASLKEEDLEKIGVTQVGARKKIMAAIGGNETQMCVICMDIPRSIVLDPCGHMSMCTACSRKVKRCPICRTKVHKTILVFQS